MALTELVKKITPPEGIAKTPLEILRRGREELQQEGRWLQGHLVCPIVKAGEQVNPVYEVTHHDALAQEILRNGACGQGWGMCAMGALSYEAGLTALVARRLDVLDGEGGWVTKTLRSITSLVTEDGSPTYHYEDFHGHVPAVRVKRYTEAGKALDAAAQELFGAENVVAVNDDENWDGDQAHPERALRNVIACFDRAIEMLEGK